jgi:hypothetical protein
VNDIATHLNQRLALIAEEGLKAAKIAVTQIKSANASQLGNSRIWFLYDKAISQEFSDALNKAAGLIAAIAGTEARQYAGHLEKFALDLGNQIIEWREQRRKSASAFGETASLKEHIDRVREALGKARASIVGDFRFGVVEEKPVASNPVQQAITIQNVSDSIITVVQTGHLSGTYQEFGRQLAEVLNSPEVERLPTDEKEEVAVLAEAVKDELDKAPSPDQGKLARRASLLFKALGRFGANTASATLGKLIVDYLNSGG